jgi:hypothetical protein
MAVHACHSRIAGHHVDHQQHLLIHGAWHVTYTIVSQEQRKCLIISDLHFHSGVPSMLQAQATNYSTTCLEFPPSGLACDDKGPNMTALLLPLAVCVSPTAVVVAADAYAVQAAPFSHCRCPAHAVLLLPASGSGWRAGEGRLLLGRLGTCNLLSVS